MLKGANDKYEGEEQTASQREFTHLSRRGSYIHNWDRSKANPSLNRYKDILAHGATAIRKKPSFIGDTNDYINANRFTLEICEWYRQDYIMTQGPMPNTVFDFWAMVFNERCPMIVMVTSEVESGRTKCHMYWPASEGEEVSNDYITVECTDSVDYGHSVVTHLTVIVGDESLEVVHVRFKDWPDHGVPADPRCFTKLVSTAMELNANKPGPVVVHCSAGIGRSGAYIVVSYIRGALLHLSEQDAAFLEGMDATHVAPVHDIVRFMRESRHPSVVQKPDQYVFIYTALAGIVEEFTDLAPLSIAPDKVQSGAISQSEYEHIEHIEQVHAQGALEAVSENLVLTTAAAMNNNSTPQEDQKYFTSDTWSRARDVITTDRFKAKLLAFNAKLQANPVETTHAAMNNNSAPATPSNDGFKAKLQEFNAKLQQSNDHSSVADATASTTGRPKRRDSFVSVTDEDRASFQSRAPTVHDDSNNPFADIAASDGPTLVGKNGNPFDMSDPLPALPDHAATPPIGTRAPTPPLDHPPLLTSPPPLSTSPPPLSHSPPLDGPRPTTPPIDNPHGTAPAMHPVAFDKSRSELAQKNFVDTFFASNASSVSESGKVCYTCCDSSLQVDDSNIVPCKQMTANSFRSVHLRILPS